MDNLTNITNFLKALSDPTRLKIVEYLSSTGKARCVSAISKHINVSQSATSQHLRILRQSNLVKSDRKGYHIHYELNTEELKKHLNGLKNILQK
ncbi:MAG: ArsR/SmtB family transcription factor [Bacteroidales bacterium]